MPELPEAENIGRALKRVLTGRAITKVEVFTPAMRTSLLPLREAKLEGRIFTDVRRRARYLIADLDDGRGLLMHFGMSGVVRVESLEVPKRKHEHVFLHLDDGRAFRFECTRRFSLLEVCEPIGPERIPASLAELGVEPLTAKLNGKYLLEHALKRAVPIKSLVMDNLTVVGIGNIYATESLFAAGIDPRRCAKTLTLAECETFCREVKRILKRAIEMGGTTISDFLNVDGSEGKFVQELRVYGKAGEVCPRCGATLEAVKIGGRNSCFCPKCQK